MLFISALNKKLHSRPVSLNLANDERGLTTVEYVVILVIIAVGAIAVWQKFGKAVADKVGGAGTEITNMKAQ